MPRQLEGTRVIDVTSVLIGPFAPPCLAEVGVMTTNRCKRKMVKVRPRMDLTWAAQMQLRVPPPDLLPMPGDLAGECGRGAGLRAAQHLFHSVHLSDDAREGPCAIAAKRAPRRTVR